jgi:hypothetical protein
LYRPLEGRVLEYEFVVEPQQQRRRLRRPSRPIRPFGPLHVADESLVQLGYLDEEYREYNRAIFDDLGDGGEPAFRAASSDVDCMVVLDLIL